MRIRRFSEDVGFDDEQMRDRLEIPNLRGEFEPDSQTMSPFYKHSDKINTESELKKVLFRFPILKRFRKDNKRLEGSLLASFYATSKEPVDDENEYYAQLSFAYHDGEYYVGSILRNIEDNENEEEWVRHNFRFDDIEGVFQIGDSFVKICKQLKIIDDLDLIPYSPQLN